MNSGGIWAPCLSYADGVYYFYTDVKSFDLWLTGHNYLTTATEVTGRWSDPVYLNSSGFDPSLFHDTDGRKWLLNMELDLRSGRETFFSGILLQEYSPVQKRLVGPVTRIFTGTPLGKTEGPHLYRRHGYYYLMTAEGGTEVNHAVTMARSRSIIGPYEVDPENPMLTSRGRTDLPLQKAGHASLVETQHGEWYLAHLCGRPLPGTDRCVLGRETALQKVYWTEDRWLRLEGGGNQPRVQVPAPDLPRYPMPVRPARDDFDAPELNVNWSTLRIPVDEDLLSLRERPGFLRLKGGDPLTSCFRQALVARRQQAFRYTATTCVEFHPTSFQQMAGLVCYYDAHGFFYLYLSYDEQHGVCLDVMARIARDHIYRSTHDAPVSLAGWQKYYLRAFVDYSALQFSYSADGTVWTDIGPVLDMSTLSDEYGMGLRFTGAFVGLCCQDLTGTHRAADFDFFEYMEE